MHMSFLLVAVMIIEYRELNVATVLFQNTIS
jgi:hypothetical protein